MYGKIILFLFGLLVLYYAVMIYLDIQKAKAEKAAELEKNKEEIIDISEVAMMFQPVTITRQDIKASVKKPVQTVKQTEPEKTKDKEELKAVTSEKSKTPEQSDTSKSKEASTKVDSGISDNIYFHDKSIIPQDKPQKTDTESLDEDEKDDDNDELELSVNENTQQTKLKNEPTMTEAYDVDSLVQEARLLAEGGDCALSNVIHHCKQIA